MVLRLAVAAKSGEECGNGWSRWLHSIKEVFHLLAHLLARRVDMGGRKWRWNSMKWMLVFVILALFG